MTNALRKLAFGHGALRHLAELALLVGAYFIYEVVGKFLIPNVEVIAFVNAKKVIHLESVLGFFWELRWQQWAIVNWQAAIVFFNYIYTVAYWPIIFTTAIIMYIKDRPAYHRYRSVVLLSFVVALILFSAFPLAPPRLLPEYGFIDTIQVFGPAQYGSRDMAAFYNLYAAMPSLHLGWTLLLGIYFFRRKNKLLKLFGIAYPTLTFFAITLTANHYIIDAVGGALVLLTGYVLYRGLLYLKARSHLSRARAPRTAYPRHRSVQVDTLFG